MIKTSKFKKVIAFLMLMILCITNVQPIFAASGSGTYTGGQFASYMNTTDHPNTQYGVLIRFLVNTKTGEKKTVFCAEHDVDFATSVAYNGEYYTPTNSALKKACKIAYVGWYSKYGDYVVNGGMSNQAKKDYTYTQQYIWQTLGQSNASFTNSTYQAEYEDYKREIDNTISNIEKRPSFDGSTITIQAGESKTITDEYGVFSKYESVNKTQDGITFTHNKGDNFLTISVDENTNIENYNISDSTFKSWGLIREDTQDNDTMIYFEFKDGVQNQLYSMHYNDPISLRMSLKIELFGKLELSKLNANKDLVDGSVFTVNGPGYNGDVTVRNGKILLEKIKKGTYTIKEKSVGTGYLLNTESYKAEVKPNQTTTQAIINNEPTGEISLIKTDKDTGNSNRVDGTSHHGDVNLKGTEYTLYAKEDIYNVARTVKYFSKNEQIAKFTFDEYGKATVIVTNKTTPAKLSVEGNTLKGLPMGSFYAKETYVVEGYMQDNTEHTYTLSYQDMNTPVIKTSDTLKNTVQKAKFEVIKISSNTNTTAPVIANAEFTAILTKYVDYYGSFDEALKHLDQYSEDEYSIFKTGADGHGVSGLLAYGEYTVYETYTPSDEIETVEPFYIKIDRNSDGVIKEFVENDTPFESYLKLVKIDKNTGKKVTLSNATFKLERLNEETNEWEKVTCKLGKETFDSWTTDENGVAYTETKVKAGKFKISELVIPKGFLQLDEEIIFEVNKSNKTLEFDKDYDAYITVTVANEQPTGTLKIDKSVAIREDVDTSLVDISDLSGIKFKLTAKEDIIDYADGSVIYEKGKEIGQYNLSKEGKLTVDSIPMGKFELEEVATLEGLVLDTTKHEVEFKQEDTKTKVYTNEEKLVNDTTVVEFSKTSITGDKELEGATLTVTDGEGKVIDRWVSGEKTHKIEGLKTGDAYTLKEEIQVDSYVKATDIKFTVENTNKVQKVTMIDKVVDMSKVDIGGNEIEGVKMQVLDHEGNIVDEWVSDKEPHKIKNLEEGKSYILHEEVCIDGFAKATDVEFEVTTDKETQHLEMVDKIVEMSKVDIGGEEIEGATIQVLDEEDNVIDEWVSGKEAHKISGLEEGKSYKLHEEISAEGYVKATDVEFKVSYDKETQHLEMVDKIVDVIKTDMVNGEEVEGAELVVTDEEGNEIDKWTSTKEPHHVVGLEEGKKYTLTELTSPYGYETAETIEFEVTLDKATQLIEMKDMPILKSVQVEKIDKDTGEHIKSNKFTFGIFEDEECTKLIKEVGANEFEGTALFEDLRYNTYYIKELRSSFRL